MHIGSRLSAIGYRLLLLPGISLDLRIDLVLFDRPLLVRLTVERRFDLVRQHDAVHLLVVAQVHRERAELWRVALHFRSSALHLFGRGRRTTGPTTGPTARTAGTTRSSGTAAGTAVDHHHRLRILVLHHQRQVRTLIDEQAQRAAGLFLRFENVGFAFG